MPRRLNTSRELHDAIKNKGFIVIRKKQRTNSRIHATSCYSLRLIRFTTDDSPLKVGKAEPEYYFCRDRREADKLWREEVAGGRKKPIRWSIRCCGQRSPDVPQ